MPGQVAVDGVLAGIARRPYQAGIRLAGPAPVRDDSTMYEVYASIPVLFTQLET